MDNETTPTEEPITDENMELTEEPTEDSKETELDPLDFDDSEVETFDPLPETKEEVDEESDSTSEAKGKGDDSEDADNEENSDEKSGESEEPASEDRLEALTDKAKGLGFTSEELRGLDADQIQETLKIYEGKIVEDDDFKVDLDPEVYDEEVVGAIRGVHEHYSKKVSVLEEKIAKLEAGMETSVRESAVARQDTFFADLGAGYKKLFGEGPTAYMDKDSGSYKNREKLRQEMFSLATGYAESGTAVPSERELFKRAVMTGFGDEFEKINATKLRDKFNRRTKISRPTQQGRTQQSATQTAMDSVAQILDKSGISDRYGQDEVFE